MSECQHLEPFIPLRKGELIEALCADRGLSPEEREGFARFCRLVGAVSHSENHQLLEKLKAAYAPFDPDADTKELGRLTAEGRQQRLNELFREFTRLMEGADFRHLGREDLEPALQGASEWGLHMDVDFRVFERLAIFARGDTVQSRARRDWKRGGKLKEREVPIYQRVVMILKLRPTRRLGPQKVDTDKVYLQLFKDIPRLDVKMLLPGARFRISRLDRGKIGVSLLSAVAIMAWRVAQEVAHELGEIVLAWQHPLALWGLATGAVGYGVRTWYGWQQTRQRYHLSLTQLLYFQNLDTNAGVLFRLLDEAEEQYCREVILAYYFLWRQGGEAGWTCQVLDASVRRDLQRRANLDVAFEIKEAVARLQRLGLIEQVGDCYHALPLPQALQVLERTLANGHVTQDGRQATAAQGPAAPR